MLHENESPIDRAGVLAEQVKVMSQMLMQLTQDDDADVVTLANVIHEKAVELEQMVERVALAK
jgi:hypothetical protein